MYPKGSVLGPLIFLILMGDIDNGLFYTMLRSFADDTRVLKCISNVKEASHLQEDLFRIYDWATLNNMEFNSLKFEVLRYGADDALKLCTNYLSSSGTIIDDKDHICDLGVMMSNDCSFSTQINHIVDSATQMLSWILRSFKSRHPQMMITLWKTLVLPKIEYCSQLWNPTKKGDIQRIELVQKSLLRKIDGSYGLNYWECLSKFNLYSLQRRRERYQVIYVWKILENIVPNIGNHGIAYHFSPRIGRTCDIKQVNNNAPRKIQNLREASIVVHGARLFNCLPRDIRNLSQCSTDTFKLHLDNFLRKVPDEPCIPGYTAMRQSDSISLLDMQGTIRNILYEVKAPHFILGDQL